MTAAAGSTASPRRALIIFAALALVWFFAYATGGFGFSGLSAMFALATALDVVVALLLLRGVLGFFVDFSRPNGLWKILAELTEPFVSLFGAVIPAALGAKARPFAALFMLFILRVMLFGGPAFFPIQPLWGLLIDFQSLPQTLKLYLYAWAEGAGRLAAPPSDGV